MEEIRERKQAAQGQAVSMSVDFSKKLQFDDDQEGSLKGAAAAGSASIEDNEAEPINNNDNTNRGAGGGKRKNKKANKN